MPDVMWFWALTRGRLSRDSAEVKVSLQVCVQVRDGLGTSFFKE